LAALQEAEVRLSLLILSLRPSFEDNVSCCEIKELKLLSMNRSATNYLSYRSIICLLPRKRLQDRKSQLRRGKKRTKEYHNDRDRQSQLRADESLRRARVSTIFDIMFVFLSSLVFYMAIILLHSLYYCVTPSDIIWCLSATCENPGDLSFTPLLHLSSRTTR